MFVSQIETHIKIQTANVMAKQLSQAAIDHIESTPLLFAELAEALDIKNPSVAQLINRKSERLLRYDVVVMIAESMNVAPLEIMEEQITVPEADKNLSYTETTAAV